MTAFPLLWQPPQTQSGNFDWVVNTFDTDSSDLSLVPLMQHEPWETVDRRAALDTGFTLGVFPQILQLEQRLFAAMRTNHRPVLTLPPEKSKSIPALMHQIPISTIIATSDAFKTILEITPPDLASRLTYQVIVGMHKKPPEIALENVLLEVHLVPSMIGLYQCPQLAAEKKYEFHMSDRFVWSVLKDRVSVSDKGESARFTDAELPHQFSHRTAPCSCSASQRLSYL
mgnify:CR=1 FL=1